MFVEQILVRCPESSATVFYLIKRTFKNQHKNKPDDDTVREGRRTVLRADEQKKKECAQCTGV
jgi:hypothetical protein